MSRCKPVEDLTWSLGREPSVHSPNKEEKEYEDDEEKEGEGKGEKEGDKEESDEKEGEEEDQTEGNGAVAQTDGRGHRKFILPLIWTVNDFYSTMSQKVTLRDHY